MSRHRIAALEPAHEVYVGWDEPLGSYFGQVYDPARPEEENPIYWVGAGNPRQYPEIEGLARAMTQFAVIPMETVRTLFRDKDLRR